MPTKTNTGTGTRQDPVLCLSMDGVRILLLRTIVGLAMQHIPMQPAYKPMADGLAALGAEISTRLDLAERQLQGINAP